MFDYLAGSMYLIACQNWTFFIHLVKPLEGMYRSFIWILCKLEKYTFKPSLWSLGSSWRHLHLKKSSSFPKFDRLVMINLAVKGSLYSARPSVENCFETLQLSWIPQTIWSAELSSELVTLSWLCGLSFTAFSRLSMAWVCTFTVSKE